MAETQTRERITGKRTSKAPTAGAVARSYFAAVAARDPDAMAEHWSPEGIEDIVPIGILRGPEEVRSFFRELFAAFPDAEMTIERVTSSGRVAVVQYRITATFSGAAFQGVDATGRRIELRGCDALEVENGKLVRNTAYFDNMSFARAIGMMPPMGSGAERAMKSTFNAVTKLRGTLAR